MARTLARALAMIVSFAVVVLIMLRLMPPPLRDTDLLIIGSVSTMVSLVVLFVLVAMTGGQGSSVFFKRRKKGS